MKEGWTYKTFGEVFDLQMGRTPDRKNPSLYGGDNIWVSIRDIDGKYIEDSKEHITNEAVVNSGIKLVKKGTVIMSFKLTVGKCAIARKDLYTNEAIMAFNVDKGFILDSSFLYYYLQGYRWSGTNKAVMGLTLNKATISKQKIAIPPIAEQERIVAELDLLSGIIDKKKEQLKAYDQLAQSIFYTMFGDPIDNPKGWEVKYMNELFDIGSSKRVFESQWQNEGIPFYRAREIVKFAKNEPIDSPIFVSEELYSEYAGKYGVPSKGDIMVTAVGTLGVCYIVKAEDRFYFKDGNILWFKSKGLCESRFIKDQYATPFVMDQIQGNANAAVVGTYTITNAKKTKVIVPPLQLQKDYVQEVEAIERQKALVQQSIDETQTMFDCTMDKYFG